PICFALKPAVKPFTYARAWLIVGKDGTKYSEMGTAWAREQNLPRDNRHIGEVGILPGSRLAAIPKSKWEARNAIFRSKLHDFVNTIKTNPARDGIEPQQTTGGQRPRLLAQVGETTYEV